MHPVIYDVAVSVDGMIAGPDENISLFAQDGPVVEDYRDRLASYRCAIMGRATYEFGYRFGMAPGQNPYAHMKTIVFSSRLKLPAGTDVEVVNGDATDHVRVLRKDVPGPIYLCGGGALAAALLRAGLIDRLRLKRAPAVLGAGVPLFRSPPPAAMTLIAQKDYGDGYLYQEFDLRR